MLKEKLTEMSHLVNGKKKIKKEEYKRLRSAYEKALSRAP